MTSSKFQRAKLTHQHRHIMKSNGTSLKHTFQATGAIINIASEQRKLFLIFFFFTFQTAMQNQEMQSTKAGTTLQLQGLYIVLEQRLNTGYSF